MSYDAIGIQLKWTWTVPNPANWQIWYRLSGLGSYSLFNTVAGTAGAYASPPAGYDYYIVGVDAAGNSYTSNSNVVTH